MKATFLLIVMFLTSSDLTLANSGKSLSNHKPIYGDCKRVKYPNSDTVFVAKKDLLVKNSNKSTSTINILERKYNDLKSGSNIEVRFRLINLPGKSAVKIKANTTKFKVTSSKDYETLLESNHQRYFFVCYKHYPRRKRCEISEISKAMGDIFTVGCGELKLIPANHHETESPSESEVSI